MDLIGANLQAVNQRIATAAQDCGRNPADIALIAVTKTLPAPAVAAALAHGQYAFAESYVQEALEKIAILDVEALKSRLAQPYLKDDATPGDARSPSGRVASPGGPLLRPLEWHFIGPIQSNKTRAIAENFAWVHSVDRPRIAERLSSARPAVLPLLQVCIQVNIGDGNAKSGIAPHKAIELARVVAALPRLKLRGLMTIPPASARHTEQRRYFARLRQLKGELTAAGFTLDTLSMGMSGDLEAAIIEGATIVRVGSAIFGPRAMKIAV